MKRIFIPVTMILLCSGCIWPKYYNSQTADVYINHIVPNLGEDVTVSINNTPTKLYNNKYIKVPRHLNNPYITIQKRGFEPYRIRLKRQLTDEKWAQYWPTEAKPKPLSAAYLPLFANTGYGFGAAWTNYHRDGFWLCLGNSLGAGLLSLPFNVVADAYNLVIGWPSTAIVNPWYNFTYEGTHLRK